MCQYRFTWRSTPTKGITARVIEPFDQILTFLVVTDETIRRIAGYPPFDAKLEPMLPKRLFPIWMADERPGDAIDLRSVAICNKVKTEFAEVDSRITDRAFDQYEASFYDEMIQLVFFHFYS